MRNPDLKYSPSGKPSGAPTSFPGSWTTDAHHHDTKPIFGRTLPNKVVETAWSRRNNLAGLDPLQVPVSLLCYKGIENVSLRWLAAGDFVSVIFGRSIKETVLCEKLMQELRSLGMDIDTLAQNLWQNSHPTQALALNSQEARAELLAFVAKELVAPLRRQVTTDLIKAQETIKKLEMQIASTEAGKDAPNSLPVAAPPSKKRRTVEGAPAAVVSDLDGFDSQRPFHMDYVVANRTLHQSAPNGHTPAVVTKWLKNLRLPDGVASAFKDAMTCSADSAKDLSPEQRSNLKDRAAEFGLPVSRAVNMKDHELYRCILVAYALTFA